ncbi:hypothetical protein XAB3213_1240005 [Xanthomonas citri pv. bilvae]|nr:hypothetical protein XAB3213_1240005 [Xanthomonas citri pv. bilvae]
MHSQSKRRVHAIARAPGEMIKDARGNARTDEAPHPHCIVQAALSATDARACPIDSRCACATGR